MTRILVLFTALALALAAVGADGGMGQAKGDCRLRADWPAPRRELAEQVVALVNDYRERIDRAPLKVSPSLARAAVWKASHMARYGYMRHDDPAPPVKRSVAERLEACGYPVRRFPAGENIAYGFATPEAVMAAWLRSAGHRANIRNPDYTVIGVGVAVGATGLRYWAQEFGTYEAGALVPAGARTRRGRGARSGGSEDRTPPARPRVKGPRETFDLDPTFQFSSRDRRTPRSKLRYRCSFDSPRLRPCRPRHSQPLAAGRHILRVQAVDAAGNRSRVTTVVVVIVPSADLAVAKSASAERLGVGSLLTYTLTVRNSGPASAASVTVRDALPAGMSAVSVAAARGSCTATTSLVCDLGSLARGDSATVTVVVLVTTTGTVTNRAGASSATADPDMANNEASATVTVTLAPRPGYRPTA
ncbi:MAG: CAP domain-containing protein [Actinomycetota bacterium]|nr:CAP domain-containing protein [Actinomycetota bacterium]